MMTKATDDIWDIIIETRFLYNGTHTYSLDGLYHGCGQPITYRDIYNALYRNPNIILTVQNAVYFVVDDELVVLTHFGHIMLISREYITTSSTTGKNNIVPGFYIPENISQFIQRIHALGLVYQRMLS